MISQKLSLRSAGRDSRSTHCLFQRCQSCLSEGAEILENYDSFIFQGKRYLAVVAGIIGARRARLPDFRGNNAARADARRPEALPCLESQNGTWNRLTTARPLTRLEPLSGFAGLYQTGNS